jgi:hypothetical protein
MLAHSTPLCELLGRFNTNCVQQRNFCKADSVSGCSEIVIHLCSILFSTMFSGVSEGKVNQEVKCNKILII